MKNNSDLNSKKLSSGSLPYVLRFNLTGESYLYYENSPTSILFSRVEKRCFFSEKKNRKPFKKINKT